MKKIIFAEKLDNESKIIQKINKDKSSFKWPKNIFHIP